MHVGSRLTGWVIAAFLLVAWGCAPFGKGTTRQTKYYVLSSMYARNEVRPLADIGGVAIGVGPVRFPRHLDRKEIVTRTGENEVWMDEFALWAGPLSENFNRVLAENLSVLLGANQVAVFPWRTNLPIAYQVVVDVTRFDGQPGTEAWLRARWRVLTDNGKRVACMNQSSFREPAPGEGIKGLVLAKSRAVEALSREIAEAIARLAAAGGG